MQRSRQINIKIEQQVNVNKQQKIKIANKKQSESITKITSCDSQTSFSGAGRERKRGRKYLSLLLFPYSQCFCARFSFHRICAVYRLSKRGGCCWWEGKTSFHLNTQGKIRILCCHSWLHFILSRHHQHNNINFVSKPKHLCKYSLQIFAGIPIANTI